MYTREHFRSFNTIVLRSILLLSIFISGKYFLSAQTPPKPPGPGATVEQVKKNIQVLTGMPASHLNTVMNYFAASLGVQCNHCHVIDTTGWYMDKDDKATKRTARNMIQMVKDLNEKSFGGREAVTCFTCHHGSTEPIKVIPLPRPSTEPKSEEQAVEPALPSVEQVMAMYEKALGGNDAIQKIKNRVSKGVSVDGQGREMPIEVLQDASAKYVASVTMKEGMSRMHGFDGTKGWMSSPRGSRELSSEESEDVKREGSLFPLFRMKELSQSLHIKERVNVNGSPAFNLTSPAGEHVTESYYIDSMSGLLVRKVIMTETMVGNIPEQVDYNDYRLVNGVQVPFSVVTSSVDSHDNSADQFTSIEQNVSIDDSKFTMPKAKPQKY